MQYEIRLALGNFQLVLVKRCGHFAWLEQQDEFYRTVVAFLAGGKSAQ